MRAALALLLAAVALPAAGAAGARRTESSRVGTRTWAPARRSPCDAPHTGPLVYHWPIKPFDRQHPIRGFFGDPRTVSIGDSELGDSTPATPGSYTFHNGVDISAPTGTAVYPVVSGRAGIGYGDEVIVVTRDDRTFQYFHIRPAISPGEHVVADRTVLGHVLPGLLHVHLTEIDGFRVRNPLDPGHLEPYRDRTVPVVHWIEATGPGGILLGDGALHGRVRFEADATDTPPLPVRGAWFGLPVTPALVQWRLTRDGASARVRWRTAVDFRRTEPPNRDFWRVYAAGTYQNFPVFGDKYFMRQPGRYIFELDPRPVNTRRLENGAYTLAVRASDVCGNSGMLRVPVRVENGQPVLRSAAAIPAIERRSGAAASSSPER